MILSAATRALGQLTDPRVLKILLLSIVLATLAVIIVIVGGIWGISALFNLWDSINGISLPWIGQVAWLEILGVGGAALGLSVIGVFLFFPLAAAAASFFYEDVVEAVEARHYPQLAPAQSASLLAGLAEAGRFLLLVVGVNLLAFILGLIFAPLSTLFYWAANSYLIGREMLFVVALRRQSREEVKALWRRHLPLFWGTAAVLFLPMNLPILNFVALVLAVAVFTHLYHGLKQT